MVEKAMGTVPNHCNPISKTPFEKRTAAFTVPLAGTAIEDLRICPPDMLHLVALPAAVVFLWVCKTTC